MKIALMLVALLVANVPALGSAGSESTDVTGDEHVALSVTGGFSDLDLSVACDDPSVDITGSKFTLENGVISLDLGVVDHSASVSCAAVKEHGHSQLRNVWGGILMLAGPSKGITFGFEAERACYNVYDWDNGAQRITSGCIQAEFLDDVLHFEAPTSGTYRDGTPYDFSGQLAVAQINTRGEYVLTAGSLSPSRIYTMDALLIGEVTL